MMRYVRRRDFLIVGKFLGTIMQGVGLIVLLPIIVALIYNEGHYPSFIIPSLLSMVTGTIIIRILKGYPVSGDMIKLKHGMMVASLGWLWATFIGALILMLYLNIDFVNAAFENMSGWTTTGLSIFSDVESLPKSILFLRSLEQWVGGLGVIIIFIGVLIKPGTAASRLYKSEARDERIKPSIVNTVKTMWWIYLTYTIMGIALYCVSGMPLFDAINHTFAALSTGGFSTKNLNIGYYQNNIIYIISMLLMILGGTNFIVHYQLLKGNIKNALKDVQLQTTIAFLILFSILVLFLGRLATMEGIFHVVSALSTTGFSINPLDAMIAWPAYVKLILTVCMIIGMAAGSTGGGVKLLRIITMIKGVYWEIIRILAPEGSVIPRRISDKSIGDLEIKEAGSYLNLYFIFIFISWSILLLYGYEPLNSLFEVASAQSNVGLSLGITSFTLPAIPKIALIFNMWIGRLEIIPILVLIRGIIEVFKR
ncbi:MAG TPA: TrkH family potassium uptake protein [Methanothermobacter sp.]|nr:TrkH family potassium uptake protein [Methanothermobacter sp.]HOK72158.1 TrkH family potassium uptake protein [Methanothermobacter sp.]HPU37258.1 TrkH family potassium uptake protein [Methanothermobacter sp.]